MTFNGSNDALTIVWGSPNDNNPAATNTVSFYTGANGTGSLIGQVLASDLYSDFSGINNTQDPGYLISFHDAAEFRQRRVHDWIERLRVRRRPRAVDLGDAGRRLCRPRRARRANSVRACAWRRRSAEPATRADRPQFADSSDQRQGHWIQSLVLPDRGLFRLRQYAEIYNCRLAVETSKRTCP